MSSGISIRDSSQSREGRSLWNGNGRGGVPDNQLLCLAGLCEAFDDDVAALLDNLTPLVKKRKPKPCKQVMAEISNFTWPDKFSGQISDLDKYINKYKFKDALEVLEVLRERLT